MSLRQAFLGELIRKLKDVSVPTARKNTACQRRAR